MPDIDRIFDRTDGRCHLCGKRLARKNYARMGERGAWEIEHSRPRARGGTDHGNNLFPSCISCNRAKGARPSRTVRRQHGRTRAPMSRREQSRVRRRRAVLGGSFGVVVGRAIWGGPATWVAAGIMAAVGLLMDPES